MDMKICCKYCLDIFKSAKGLEIHQKECKNIPISERFSEPAAKRSKGITEIDEVKDTEIVPKADYTQETLTPQNKPKLVLKANWNYSEKIQ